MHTRSPKNRPGYRDWPPAATSYPQSVARGIPTTDYPYPWSKYRWISGTTAGEAITDWRPTATPLT